MGEVLTATVSPALDHIIERPRLIARIVEGDARVTVFAAPAGFGKTTLARQWGERQTGPVVWYRTTRASGDVAALAVGLDEALASIAPELPRDPGRVARIASVNPSPRPLGRALVQMYEPLTEDVLLIVDEWEAAGTEEAEQLLSTLVDQLSIRFLITTRARPDWFTPRLEVYGEGLEISVDELTMTDAEAADVLFYLRNKDARDEVASVAKGWPAVLGLAALNARSSRHTGRTASLPDTLYKFLASELIEATDTSARRAAAVIATTGTAELEVARQLLGPSADTGLGSAQAAGLIAVDGGSKLSMHPLISQAITRRQTSALPEHLSDLVEPVLKHRLWNEAIALAEAVPDAAFISQVLPTALPELLRTGRLRIVRRWVEAGRTAEVDAGIVDCADAELSLRQGELLRAYGLGVQTSKQLTGDLAAHAHLIAAQAAHLTDRPDATLSHVEAAQSLAQSVETREGAAWLSFLAHLELEADDLSAAFAEYGRLARIGVDQALSLATGQLSIAEVEGQLDAAMNGAEVALALVDGTADPMRHTGLLSTYSYALVLAGRYEMSLQRAEELAHVAETYELEFARRYADHNKAASLIGLRKFAVADRLLASLDKTTKHEAGTYFGGNVAIQRARLYASTGETKRALEVLSLGPTDSWIRAARGEYLALRGLLLAASGSPDEAVEQVRQARIASRGVETRALTYVTEAIVSLLGGRQEDVDASIDAAITTEALDPIVIGLRSAPCLAGFLGAQGRRSQWLRRLLMASSDTSLARAVGLKIPRVARPKQRLSAREAEIHQLIAHGLTNEEISKLLFISLSTTKVHVKHILDKLGARSRVEAARMLDDSDYA